MIKRHAGFSLVELLVAMVIGLVIMLGAGRIFLTVLQTSRHVEMLGEKQAAVNLVAEMLLRDIRRAVWSRSGWSTDASGDAVLTLAVENRGDALTHCAPGDEVLKNYKLQERKIADEVAWFMALEVARCADVARGGGYRELVGGFIGPDAVTPGPGFAVDDRRWDEGVLQITLRLMSIGEDVAPDTLTFLAVNRTEALAP